MDCKRTDELLIDYLYEELDPEQRAQVEQHLAQCPSCQSQFQELGSVLTLMRDQTTVEEPPPELSQRIMHAARTAVEYSQHQQAAAAQEKLAGPARWLRWLSNPVAISAVLALVLVGVGLMAYKGSGPLSPEGAEVQSDQKTMVTAAKKPARATAPALGEKALLPSDAKERDEKPKAETRLAAAAKPNLAQPTAMEPEYESEENAGSKQEDPDDRGGIGRGALDRAPDKAEDKRSDQAGEALAKAPLRKKRKSKGRRRANLPGGDRAAGGKAGPQDSTDGLAAGHALGGALGKAGPYKTSDDKAIRGPMADFEKKPQDSPLPPPRPDGIKDKPAERDSRKTEARFAQPPPAVRPRPKADKRLQDRMGQDMDDSAADESSPAKPRPEPITRTPPPPPAPKGGFATREESLDLESVNSGARERKSSRAGRSKKYSPAPQATIASADYGEAESAKAQKPDELYLAQQALNNKSYAQAARHYQSFLAQHPGSARAAVARYKLARSLFLAGQCSKAQQAARTALNKHPGHHLAADTMFDLASCQIRLGQFAQAISTYESIQRKHPGRSGEAQRELQRIRPQEQRQAAPAAERN